MTDKGTSGQSGAVDKVLFKNLYWKIDKKKDAHWRHFMAHIIRFKFKAVAERRQ